MNLNRVLLAGRLTRDPELRYTPKGTPLVELGLAVNRIWTEEGQKREETTFVDVTLWGRTAEVAQQYLHKGSPCFIEGRLRTETWQDKGTGEKRSRMCVVCESLQLLGERRRELTPSRGSVERASVPLQRSIPPREPDSSENIPF